MHRGGTALPGRVALKICPDLLRYFSDSITTVIITGTNGKTTTARMTEQIFVENGLDYFANRSGSNLSYGIAGEFILNSSFSGKMKKKYAIIECDEAALQTVTKYLKPKVIAVTNLFRDQLDRYGEVTNTLNKIKAGIANSDKSVICLNADCSLTSSISDNSADSQMVFFYGIDDTEVATSENDLSDASLCIKCGTEYEYEYHTYGHLGGFVCPKCGYRRTTPDMSVKKIISANIDSSEIEIETETGSGKKTFTAKISLPALYNVYNAVCALAIAQTTGLDIDKSAYALRNVESGFGRMESFVLNGVNIKMILVKNPAGCNRAIEYLRKIEDEFILVACLNDNYADGIDVSWIWDADYESLIATGKIAEAYIMGTRSEDMFLRLKYAGIDENKVTIIEESKNLIDILGNSERPVYIIPNYTSMLSLRGELSKICGKKEFWE